ncbi:hypothetical protein MASR2M54_07580 [Aliarcobacter cryaerophilus]
MRPYKIQIDYMQTDASDIKSRVNCAIEIILAYLIYKFFLFSRRSKVTSSEFKTHILKQIYNLFLFHIYIY